MSYTATKQLIGRISKEELDKTWEIIVRKNKPNNWLKMHGYPMRRKLRGTRKKKNISRVFVDEACAYLQEQHIGAYFHDLIRRSRGNISSVPPSQPPPLPAPSGSAQNLCLR